MQVGVLLNKNNEKACEKRGGEEGYLHTYFDDQYIHTQQV